MYVCMCVYTYIHLHIYISLAGRLPLDFPTENITPAAPLSLAVLYSVPQ